MSLTTTVARFICALLLLGPTAAFSQATVVGQTSGQVVYFDFNFGEYTVYANYGQYAIRAEWCPNFISTIVTAGAGAAFASASGYSSGGTIFASASAKLLRSDTCRSW
jgi:hypothetical protein